MGPTSFATYTYCFFKASSFSITLDVSRSLTFITSGAGFGHRVLFVILVHCLLKQVNVDIYRLLVKHLLRHIANQKIRLTREQIQHLPELHQVCRISAIFTATGLSTFP